jgi:hypothetical protein
MIVGSAELVGMSLSVSPDELRIRLKDKPKGRVYANFKFDGTYELGDRFWSIYAKPFIVCKTCPVCNYDIDTRLIKPSTPAPSLSSSNMTMAATSHTPSVFSSIDNLKKKICFYSFALNINDDGTYNCWMFREFAGFSLDNSFFHINTDFTTGTSRIFRADFTQKLEDLMDLSVPAVNLTNTHNKEQLINKIKIYNMFS